MHDIFRVWVPSFRFFDRVGLQAELWVRNDDGKWTRFLNRPKARLRNLFIFPEAGLFHARNNLIERLLLEASQSSTPQNLVSYQLVRELVAGRAFKITARGEDAFVSTP